MFKQNKFKQHIGISDYLADPKQLLYNFFVVSVMD
jgi:hypothetical protein